jgi:hypothetical protein
MTNTEVCCRSAYLRDPLLSQVRRHFDTSMAAVETHREYLQKNRCGG